MARIIAGVASSHVPAIGAAIDNKQTEEPYWKRVFAGFEKSKEWIAKAKPDVCIVVYNDHASAFSVEIVPDLRARLRGRIPARRRRLGPAAGAGGEGPSRARLAHRAVGHPRRVRPDALQQDGGRPRPHGAAQPDVRLAEGMAVPGDPAGRQRRALSAADRAPLLHARQGDPQGGGVLSGGPARRDLRHRRHVAPDLRPARRPDQLEVRQGLPRQSHQGPEEAHAHPASRIHARGGRRRHRDGDVADHARRARRQGRRGLPLLHRAGVEHRGRAHHSGE